MNTETESETKIDTPFKVGEVYGSEINNRKSEEFKVIYHDTVSPSWPIIAISVRGGQIDRFTPGGYGLGARQLIPPPKLPTTVREWLETLPEPYRGLARGYVLTRDLEDECGTFKDAICQWFPWVATLEGSDFWRAVAVGEFPPIPEKPTPKKRVPLGPEDCPPGSVFRGAGNTLTHSWSNASVVHDDGVWMMGKNCNQLTFYSWEWAMENGEINRSIPTEGRWNPEAWKPMWKEVDAV